MVGEFAINSLAARCMAACSINTYKYR